MSRRTSLANGSRRLLAAFMVFTAVLLPLASLSAAEPAAPSLALVPQDAAFYTSTMRMREQIEMIASSNWWKKLNEEQLVQQAKFMIQLGLQQPGSPLTTIQELLEQPENQQLAELLKDMVSTEVFWYGDASVSGSFELLLEITNSMRFAQILRQFGGAGAGLSDEEYMAKMVLDSLNEDLDRVAVPTMVIGFRLTKKQPAEEQLKRLEAFAKVMLQQVPELEPFKDKFQRVKVGESEYLSLALDGGLLPWEEIPFGDLEDEAGQYDKLIEKLKKTKLVVSLGVFKDYALISIGRSNDHLAKLGQGKSLADHPKLAPLRTKGSLKYTAVAYASGEFMGSVTTKPEDIDNMVTVGKDLLPLAELPADVEKQLSADMDELAKDLKPYVPEPGAVMGFSYVTDRGSESYQYNWTKNIILDGSKPLPILEHLGGNPMFAVASRGQHRPQDYELLVKWLKKASGYFEQLAVPQMSEEEQEQYAQFSKVFYPLMARVDKVNRDMLMPAFADGQTALVVDAKLKTTQWVKNLPATTEPIAVPSIAMVCGVKDAAMVKKAFSEYRLIMNDAMKEMHKVNPEQVPDFQLPPAQSRELKDGTQVLYYPLPQNLGVYDRVAPNMAISEKYAVFSLIPRHTVQLVKPQPLKVDGGPLAKLDRPLASVAYFDWHATMDMVTPWVNEGVRAYVRNMEAAFQDLDIEADGALNAQADGDTAKQIIDQVQHFSQYLRAFQGFASVTYLEDGATVTHSEVRYQDIE